MSLFDEMERDFRAFEKSTNDFISEFKNTTLFSENKRLKDEILELKIKLKNTTDYAADLAIENCILKKRKRG